MDSRRMPTRAKTSSRFNKAASAASTARPTRMEDGMNTIQRSGTRRHNWLWALAIVGAISAVLPAAARAQIFVSGSTGADGSFNPSCTPLPCMVTVQLPPTGIFNYTTVNIHEGVTVRYARNQANTPVTILATGDVTIAGTIDVSGGGATSFTPGRGGPGAFDG